MAAAVSPSTAPATLEHWRPEHVAKWLETTPYVTYAPTFLQHHVSGRQLLTLTQEALAADLGVTHPPDVTGLFGLIVHLRSQDGAQALKRALAKRRTKTDVMQLISEELMERHREVMVSLHPEWSFVRRQIHAGRLARLAGAGEAEQPQHQESLI